MRDDALIWLASYPKSGNTWLRSFLAAYLEPTGHLDINALETPLAAGRQLLDDSLGIELSDLPHHAVQSLLPLAYRSWAREAPLPRRLLKVHDAFQATPTGAALFPPEITQGVVHLVRDPRDVAVSLAHHNGCEVDAAIAQLNDAHTWLAKARQAAGSQVPQFLGDWSGHARSWLEAPVARLTLRYEDLHAAPQDGFARVVAFCGFALDEQQLAQALAATAFTNLQAQEAAQGFRERPAGASAPFFRAGQVGAWRTCLTPAQAERIVAAHAEMMRHLGYVL